MRLLVLHVADIHLGKNRKYSDYLEQQGAMLRAIVAQCRDAVMSGSYDRVILVVAGDVFDKNQGTLRTEFALFLNHFIKPLTTLLRSTYNFDVVMIDGNHDRQPDLEDPSVLSPLVGVLPHGFQLAVVEPQLVTIEVPIGSDRGVKIQFLAVPYGGYTTAEFTSLITSKKADFVVAHECLARMRTDLGYSPPREQDKYIEINDVLAGVGRAPASIFLGDIHRCQSLDDNHVSWYSGSPTTLDFGHALPKGVLHHTFRYEDDHWVRDEFPQLKPLNDPSIKIHRSLGLVKTVADIPWDICYQYETTYIDMLLTPEVFNEISAKIPSFFDKRRVSFDYERDLISTKEAAKSEESSLSVDINVENDSYYDKAVAEYAALNLGHLPEHLREKFKEKVMKKFAER